MIKKLFNKYLTFIVLPHDEVGAKQKRLSYGVLAIVLLILLVSVVSFFAVVIDYNNKSMDKATFEKLVYENSILKERYRALKKNSTLNKETIMEVLDTMDNLLIVNNLPPTSNVIKEVGIGGLESPLADDNMFIMDPEFKKEIEDIGTMIVSTEKRVELAKKLLMKVSSSNKLNTEMWDNIPTTWPVYGWITSGFGTRISPMTGKREFHPGLDIAQTIGTEIIAPADGVVKYAGTRTGWGKTILVEHEYGIMTRYAHLDSIKVSIYQRVKKGDIIGRVGNTGYSIGPHLHYEIRVYGTPVDPMNYILTRKD